MNYIAEINAFYNWVMLSPIPADAQALWHALMQVDNRSAVRLGDDWYWRAEFTVANSTLTSLLAFSRQQLDRMRGVLVRAGRIAYRKGRGSSPGTYRMIPFDAHYVLQTVTLPATQTATLKATQTATLKATQVWAPSGQARYTAGPYPYNKSKNKNYTYFSDDGDEAPGPAKNGFLSGLDSWLGMSSALKEELADTVRPLFLKYFGRPAAQADLETAFGYLQGEPVADRGGGYTLDLPDGKKKLLELAFAAAQTAGCPNWNYVQGVYRNFASRGITTEDDYEDYELGRAGL